MSKNHYIIISLIIVIALGGGFYFYEFAGEKSNTAAVEMPAAVSSQPKNPDNPEKETLKILSEQALDANAKVNAELAKSIKAVDSALSSGEKGFSAMQQIYENGDYGEFFSIYDAGLKAESEKSRAAAENSFLTARSAYMLAQSDAKANTVASLDKTLAFLSDIIAALEKTRSGLSKSALTASITGDTLDNLRNNIDGSLAGVLTAKITIEKERADLAAAINNSAYQYYLKNFKEYKIE